MGSALPLGEAMYAQVADLYPICRSITGDGVRETLRRIGRRIPLTVHEVATGTPVFDWTVPKEWNIRDAYIARPDGTRIVDFRRHNLHVLNYSVPVCRRMSLAELKPHLYADPAHPDWVPYRTSYYQERWGFCLSQRQLESLEDGEYEVCIDSTLAPGALTYGECVLPGDSSDEILISCHICHPSLANDNLSGIAVATQLADLLAKQPRRHTWRFVFIPGTIGAITWLARNEAVIPRIRGGLVVVCVGDDGGFTYKQSRQGDAEIDRLVAASLVRSGHAHLVEPFSPYGYDERQYGSPGINLAVGCLMRTPHGRFPQYHTSADDLAFVKPHNLAQSLGLFLDVAGLIERNRRYLNLSPKCEPQLGKRGLYSTIGGQNDQKQIQLAVLWVLNQSDGAHDLLAIAQRSGIDFDTIHTAAVALEKAGLLRPL